MRYRFLEHTADAKFQAYGRTLEEAFVNSALATSALMWDWRTVEKRMKHRVGIKGKDLEQLLRNFLEELLYLLDSRMFLLNSVDRLKIERKENHYLLSAEFWGDDLSDKHEIFGEVKAITYNEMEIKNNDHFMIQVVVDI